jgi:hypothetical protein
VELFALRQVSEKEAGAELLGGTGLKLYTSGPKLSCALAAKKIMPGGARGRLYIAWALVHYERLTS